MTVESVEWAKLICEAKKRLEQCKNEFKTGEPKAEEMLIDIDGYSHHFVLACLMDRRIDARRAWRIPYLVGLENKKRWDFCAYEELELPAIEKIFVKLRLHRHNNKMAIIFHEGIKRISNCFGGVAKNIWIGEPAAAQVVRKFIEFNGVGQKIASMATNILIRQFKVPLRHISMVDIAVDSQVLKFFKHRGWLREDAKKIEEVIYLAREIYPDYPGLLDLVAWEGGQKKNRVGS